MLSLPQIAFSNSDILDIILSHLLDPLFNVIFYRYSTLLVTSLISRCWYERSQNQLHEQTLLQYGDAQLEQWLSRKEKEKYSVRELVLFDKYPFKEGGKWSYSLIERVLTTVKGVKEFAIAFTGQSDLPASWMSLDSLASKSLLFCDHNLTILIRARISLRRIDSDAHEHFRTFRVFRNSLVRSENCFLTRGSPSIGTRLEVNLFSHHSYSYWPS
jgi:hypothetical protein